MTFYQTMNILTIGSWVEYDTLCSSFGLGIELDFLPTSIVHVRLPHCTYGVYINMSYM